MRRFAVVLTPEPDGSAWNVTVPALPGCFTWGETEDEALVHARDAITVHLAGLAADGLPLPPGDAIGATVEIEEPEAVPV